MGRSALVIGLGNPGSMYEMTRHNIGNLVVRGLAKTLGWKFKRSIRLKAKVASGEIHGCEIHLALPMTFMNNSGVSVRRGVDHYKIEHDRLLVISDDVHIPFGKMRFRESGSTGGHNGLKNIESFLHTKDYHRLKIGVGDRYFGELSEYVLSPFEDEELKQLPKIITRSEEVIDQWIQEDIEGVKEMSSASILVT